MESLMPYYVMLIVGIAIASGGQLFLKTGADALGLWADAVHRPLHASWAGLLRPFGGALHRRDQANSAVAAYPTVALSYAVVAIAAHFLWHERIGFSQLAGIAFIWGGILLIYRT